MSGLLLFTGCSATSEKKEQSEIKKIEVVLASEAPTKSENYKFVKFFKPDSNGMYWLSNWAFE